MRAYYLLVPYYGGAKKNTNIEARVVSLVHQFPSCGYNMFY
jgi:hypothetical protein